MRTRIAIAVLSIASSAHAEGRLASVALGGGVAMNAGRNPPPIPALLQHAPELQIAWGLHAGDAVLVTRLDLIGAIVPIGPAGFGVDVGGGWAPGWKREGWAPIVRATMGAVALGSGGEMLGPDHSSYGFRLAAEVGAVRRTAVPAGMAAWGVMLGAQGTALVSVDPCSSTGDCSTALLGATLRLEGQLQF